MIERLAPVAKFIVAVLAAVIVVVAQTVAEGDAETAVSSLAAILGALGVWAVPNVPREA